MAQYSALPCVFGIWQNSEKLLISNGLRFVVTCLLMVALWVLFHLARHTNATLMLYFGGDIYTVSKLLGHTSVKTTQVYAKIVDENKRKTVNLIPNIVKD